MMRWLTFAALCCLFSWPVLADDAPPGTILMTDAEREKLIEMFAAQNALIEKLEKALLLAKTKSGCV